MAATIQIQIIWKWFILKLPDYLQKFSGSRLRRSHYDSLSVVSSIIPKAPQNLNNENSTLGISKSFFYRAHLSWNLLPLELRDIGAPSKFKVALLKYLWSNVSDIIKSEYESDILPLDWKHFIMYSSLLCYWLTKRLVLTYLLNFPKAQPAAIMLTNSLVSLVSAGWA